MREENKHLIIAFTVAIIITLFLVWGMFKVANWADGEELGLPEGLTFDIKTATPPAEDDVWIREIQILE